MCSLKNFVSCDTWGLTSLPLISWESLTGLRWVERQHNAPGPLFRGKLVCEHYVAPCKVIRIPKSRKFLLVESGILGIGIQNPAFGTQNPTKKWIQDPFLENPFSWKSISSRINGFHAHPHNPVMLKHRLHTVQTALISPKNFDCYSSLLPLNPRAKMITSAIILARGANLHVLEKTWAYDFVFLGNVGFEIIS